ncbi:MAG: tyrosine-protein phosphatase [Ilumatobacteraceae bacterium]
MIDHPDRLIALSAVLNFRDLGGYATGDGRRVAWRKVFRADGLYRLTADDLETLRPLGLRTVIDLRTAEELHERGTFPVERYPVDFHHFSIIDRTWDMEEARKWSEHQSEFLREKYHLMLEQGGDFVGAALRVIADAESAPVVFHCAAGKDRTGLVAGLLLAGLGVDDPTVAADYGLSHAAGERTREWAITASPELAERFTTMPAVFRAAHPDSLAGVLSDLRARHGDIRSFCATIGVTPDHWAALEAHLLVAA